MMTPGMAPEMTLEMALKMTLKKIKTPDYGFNQKDNKISTEKIAITLGVSSKHNKTTDKEDEKCTLRWTWIKRPLGNISG